LTEPEKYLIVKACAGLGNRLVTIFSAIKYCEKNNRRLIVDWSDGQLDEKGADAFKKCFELINIDHLDIENIENIENLTHSSNLFKKDQKAGIYDLYFDKSSSFWLKFPQRLFLFSWQKKIRRRWQPITKGGFRNSLNYGSDLKDSLPWQVLYYSDFLPSLDYTPLPAYVRLKPFMNEKISQFVKQTNLAQSVGVHIRFTDKQPTADVKKIIDHIKVKHKNSIYLSTDSREIEALFLKDISNLILFPKKKPELKGEGLHQWALYNHKEDLKYTLYEESVIEMFLLSKCQYLYYQGNSTFSNISKVYHTNKNNCYDWLQL
jgi:hypothetical protein